MKNVTVRSLLISSGLLFAATATAVWGQDPCTKNFGATDALVFAATGFEYVTGSSYVLCAAKNSADAHILVPPIGSTYAGAVSGAVMQNVPTPGFGFTSISATQVLSFVPSLAPWNFSFVLANSARFSSVGGYAYGATANGLQVRFPTVQEVQALAFPSATEFTANQKTGNGRASCSAVIVVAAGYEYCNRGGNLYQPAPQWGGGADYTSGRTYFPVADLFYGGGNTFYAMTPNTTGPHTGQLLAVTIDGNGNLTTSSIGPAALDVPGPGTGVMGTLAIYVANGNTIEAVDLASGKSSVIYTGGSGVAFSALIVLSANPVSSN